MKEMIQKSALVMCITFGCISGYAQQSKIDGLPFKIGDDVATVKAALHTTIDPEPMENPFTGAAANVANPNAGKSLIHLRTKGIWAFFKKDVVETIRLDAPFSESVAGIKLGDSEKKLFAAKGKPIKPPTPLGLNKTYQYVLDDSAYIRFEVSEADGVQTIWINK